MWAWFYANNPMMLLPVLSMFIFMGVFIMGTVRAWRRRDGHEERMPLELQEHVSTAGGRHE